VLCESWVGVDWRGYCNPSVLKVCAQNKERVVGSPHTRGTGLIAKCLKSLQVHITYIMFNGAGGDAG